MSVPIFVDTNVLIYALDRADPAKCEAARQWRAELWKSQRGRISFQVLQEFFVNVTRKWPASCDEARTEVRDLLAWRPIVIDEFVVETGWKIQDRYRLSFWDALIVAAARTAKCGYLLTEDLNADQNLDGVIVINPFLVNPEELF